MNGTIESITQANGITVSVLYDPTPEYVAEQKRIALEMIGNAPPVTDERIRVAAIALRNGDLINAANALEAATTNVLVAINAAISDV